MIRSAVVLPLGALSVIAPQEASSVLGEAYDLPTQNFWDFRGLYGFSLFATDVAEQCFQEVQCGHVSPIEHRHFSSVQSWEHHFQSSFGISVSGSYSQMTASIGASMGSQFRSNFVSERESYFFQTSNRQRCYEIGKECLTDPNNLSPAVKALVDRLPVGRNDREAMELWVNRFIKLVGTHVTVASQHGAAIRSLASVDSSCHTSSDCLQASACMDFSFIGMAGTSLCSNHTRCDMREGCNALYHDSCVMIGGDPSMTTSLCSNTTTKGQMDAFLASGDVTSGSSAIGYTFMPLSDVFLFMGLWDAADAMTKASEYHSCTSPRFVWQDNGNGDFGCQCALECENGGKLNADRCTCECLGDEFHGWTGATCSDTYGKCIKGPGSHNEEAAIQCYDDNLCASSYSSHLCQDTDICCLTHFGGACCPFGSVCDCGIPGSVDCTCMTEAEHTFRLV